MEATYIVRRIDDLGRVVIPKEIRKAKGIKEGDPLEVFVNGDMVCFRKYIEPEEEEKEKIRKYVAKHYTSILSAIFDGNTTTVIFATGEKFSVKKRPSDEFDLTMAIYYAMLKAGYKGVE